MCNSAELVDDLLQLLLQSNYVTNVLIYKQLHTTDSFILLCSSDISGRMRRQLFYLTQFERYKEYLYTKNTSLSDAFSFYVCYIPFL